MLNTEFRYRLKILLVHSAVGAALFYFVVHPVTMVVYWFEFNQINSTLDLFTNELVQRFGQSFSFKMMGMSLIFICIGILVGMGSGFYYINITSKNRQIDRQGKRLKHDLITLISHGEDDHLEFKSSLRYDYHQSTINLALEQVVLKTIAGFLNASGGRLLIGISDTGEILGLKNDYQSLRRKNADGFENKLYQLIANSIGHELCRYNQVYFHKIDGEEVCEVLVEASKVPAYVNAGKDVTFYLRIGNSTKPLSVKETVDYLKIKVAGA